MRTVVNPCHSFITSTVYFVQICELYPERIPGNCSNHFPVSNSLHYCLRNIINQIVDKYQSFKRVFVKLKGVYRLMSN